MLGVSQEKKVLLTSQTLKIYSMTSTALFVFFIIISPTDHFIEVHVAATGLNELSAFFTEVIQWDTGNISLSYIDKRIHSATAGFSAAHPLT